MQRYVINRCRVFFAYCCQIPSTVFAIPQEESILASSAELDQRRQQVDADAAGFVRKQQKAALERLLSRPWRLECETVSVAFSKWARTTMLELADEQVKQEKEVTNLEIESAIRTLEQQLHDANQSKDLLDEEKTE